MAKIQSAEPKKVEIFKEADKILIKNSGRDFSPPLRL